MKRGENSYRLKRLVSILLFLLSYGDITSQVKDQISINSPQNILKFADFLFCTNDYPRAIAEFGKYLTFHNNDTVVFKIGLSYAGIGDINNAEVTFKKLFSDISFSDAAKLETARLNFRYKRYSVLNNMLHDSVYINSHSYSSIRILNSISLLYGNDPVAGSNFDDFIYAFPESGREEMKNYFLDKLNLTNKSPLLAALLSAAIPGAGKIYTGYYGDGITAFTLTGILGYTSYSNFTADHTFRGWLFGSLAGVFYLGNIYGSAVSAQIHNSEVNLNFRVNLENYLNKKNNFLPDEKYFCK